MKYRQEAVDYISQKMMLLPINDFAEFMLDLIEASTNCLMYGSKEKLLCARCIDTAVFNGKYDDLNGGGK